MKVEVKKFSPNQMLILMALAYFADRAVEIEKEDGTKEVMPLIQVEDLEDGERIVKFPGGLLKYVFENPLGVEFHEIRPEGSKDIENMQIQIKLRPVKKSLIVAATNINQAAAEAVSRLALR